MEIYTIGFGRKTARDFFDALKDAGIRRLVDVRLNNSSQLAGFTKADHLPFFSIHPEPLFSNDLRCQRYEDRQ